MKPQNIIAVVVIILTTLPLTTKAQQDNYKLSSYKLPDLRRNEMTLSLVGLSISDNQSFFKSNLYPNPLNPKWFLTGYYENQWYNLGLTPQLTYFQMRNLSGYQGYNSARLFITPQRNKYIEEDLDLSNIRFGGELSGVNRFYLTDRLHIGLEHNLNYTYTNRELSVSYNDSTHLLNDKEKRASLSVPVTIGYGRLEELSDLRLAIYILEDLIAAGKIDELPPTEVIHKMADAISMVKNRRHFDSRIKRMEELAAIDEFLSSEGLLSEPDIEYAAIMNDLLGFGYGPARETGLLISGGIYNSLKISDMESSPDVLYRESMLQYGLMASIIKARPVNLYWQSDMHIGIRLLREREKMRGKNTMISRFDLDNLLLQSFGDWTIRYLPNSRSSLGLTLSGGYTHRTDRNKTYEGETLPFYNPYNGGDRRHSYHIGVASSGYYYFSPRLRTEYSVSYSFRNIISSNIDIENIPDGVRLFDKHVLLHFSAGISYALF